MSNQALATRDEQPLAKNDIRSLLQSEKIREQIELALPKHMSPDRMMRVALTAINKNPKLLECTRESILLSLMTCSQYGVEPDGRNAHLIPYKNSKKVGDRWESTMECQFQWDYKGLVAQIRKSPEVKDIYADYICKNDTYKVTRGLHRDLVHEFDIASERGPVIAFYSVCLFKDGTASFEIMTVDEVESIRARSKSTDKQTGKSSGPWATDYTEMGKKTVIKRHSKLLPLPSEIALALNADSDFDEIPTASVREIPKAAIPERTSLPEPSAEQDAAAPKQPYPDSQPDSQPESQPEPEVKQSQAKPAEKAKPAKKLAAAPAKQDAESLASQCEEMLKEAGYTPADLIRCAQANDWLDKSHDPETTDLSVIAEEDLKNFLDPENRETVLGEIKRCLKK